MPGGRTLSTVQDCRFADARLAARVKGVPSTRFRGPDDPCLRLVTIAGTTVLVAKPQSSPVAVSARASREPAAHHRISLRAPLLNDLDK